MLFSTPVDRFMPSMNRHSLASETTITIPDGADPLAVNSIYAKAGIQGLGGFKEDALGVWNGLTSQTKMLVGAGLALVLFGGSIFGGGRRRR